MSSIAKEPPYVRSAQYALFSFLFTFLASRIIVFLIMSERIPNLFLFLKGTHIHHLNYGIFLLSGVAGYLLFTPPKGNAVHVAAVAYGFAMALTFDEFGMWLHLGGSYWQRASIDAVIVLAALFALLAFGSSIKRFQSTHFWGFIALSIVCLFFGIVLVDAGNHIGHLMGPELEALEFRSSP